MILHRIILFGALLAGISCSQGADDARDIAVRRLEYQLYPGSSDWGFSGRVVISENDDGTASLEIVLEGTEGDRLFPVHLHGGPFGLDGDIVAMLEPVSAATGAGATPVVLDSEERPLLFDELEIFDGHIKVHLSHSGPGREIILAYGNIGVHATTLNQTMP